MHPTQFPSRRARNEDRRLAASLPAERAPPRRTHCPNCDLPAVAPVASVYLAEGLVEHSWTCSACGFAWTSNFDGLSV